MVIVFQQPLVSGFHEAELSLDDAKWVLHPGPDAGFHVFDVDGRFVLARMLQNDNQLAMLFTLANLFRVDQMIRQWERSQ